MCVFLASRQQTSPLNEKLDQYITWHSLQVMYCKYLLQIYFAGYPRKSEIFQEGSLIYVNLHTGRKRTEKGAVVGRYISFQLLLVVHSGHNMICLWEALATHWFSFRTERPFGNRIFVRLGLLQRGMPQMLKATDNKNCAIGIGSALSPSLFFLASHSRKGHPFFYSDG